MKVYFSSGIRSICLLIVLFTFSVSSYSQDCKCWGVYPLAHQRLVANVSVSPNVKGYTEVLPAGYNPAGSQRYPLIINVPGRGTRGGGTAAELCAVACEAMGLKIEQDEPFGSGNYQFQTSVSYAGQNYNFIILSPQYNWGDQESAADVQAMINYAVSHYKVDLSRIYLAGLSSGANMVINYMATSPQEARRIAAVITVGLCMGPNYASAQNMGNNRIHYWGLVGNTDNQCGWSNTVNFANLINSYSPSGNPMGKYTLFPNTNSDPHVIWPDVEDKDYRVDNKNFSEWFIQFTNGTNASLPATLGSYDVSSKGKKVVTTWTTNLESQTNYFEIERAGADMQFKSIGQVKAAGNSNQTQLYSFSDEAPLKGTSFYRLSLVNMDGAREYYDIKKIINKSFGEFITLGTAPGSKSLQFSIDLDQAQQLNLSILDANGRTVQSWSARFASGYNTQPISIEKLSSGIYFLSVRGEQFTETKKFVR